MGASDGSRNLVEQLESCLVKREIYAGCCLLDDFLRGGSVEPAALECGIPLLLCFTQWIDLGYKNATSPEQMFSNFSGRSCARMPTGEFLQFRMVEAFICMRSHNFERAVFLLNFVVESGEELLSRYQTFVAQFWLGRAHRLAGDFEKSYLHIAKAVEVAREMNATKLVAVAQIHESWLVFHRGEREHALKLLDLAEKELLPTGHALSLANISAARGRFTRSSGEYAEAFKHFARAIEIYSVSHADHPNLARALVNAAYVKRLMALDLLPKARDGAASATTHRLSNHLAGEALQLLDKAAAIYKNQKHQGGTGAVLVNTGYLRLEGGDIEQAAIVAADAYRMGERQSDLVLMARASILQGSVELAFCEEQLEEHPELGTHAILAAKYADRAIALASQTQNRRLLAASYIVRGAIAADESNLDWTLARSYAVRASAIIGEHDRDHLYRELRQLNLRISRSAAIDETMRAWCDGDLGGKSFQEVQEDFAEIVIPKVWLKLDRKVSRVAQELSISPKKVRRILRAAKQMAVG